jgi:GT2 family glycosyltransferase
MDKVIMMSFLMPTRGRPDLISRFLQSVVDTTCNLDELEIVLCIDDDDNLSKGIEDNRLSLKKVIVSKGLNMGELYRECFRASSGAYVMLINDDVILRTRNWDKTITSIFRTYQDEIALLHVNDLLFREKRCTLPLLSRRACDAIGICPAEYKRYRIDDHIWDTYCMLAHLGHKRIIYLPDVIFQHDNYFKTPADHDCQCFESDAGKATIPDELILKKDAEWFSRSFNQRKEDALKMATIIDQSACSRRRSKYITFLESVKDETRCRKPEYVHRMSLSASRKPLESVTVTIGVVTADFRNKHASRCLSLLKQHTPPEFDLILLDNNRNSNFNRSSNFNQSIEDNKILQTARTDYVVIMDDDVMVEAGWLEGMLRAMNNDTGVVAPMHKDRKGVLSFSGIYLMGDDYGTHAHLIDIPERPRETQCACGAMMLIDMHKCGDIRFDEQYYKYFLDIDFSLKIWETGYKLVVTPEVTVTHLAGATLPQGSASSTRLWNEDMPKFKKDWIDSGRLSKLQNTVWEKYPFLMLLTALPKRIRRLLEEEEEIEFSCFQKELEGLIETIEPFPLFQSLLVRRLEILASSGHHRSDNVKADYCRNLIRNRLKEVKLTPEGFIPILIESHKGYNLVEYGKTVLCCPQSLGPLNVTLEEDRLKPGVLSCMTLEEGKGEIDKILGEIPGEIQTSSQRKEILLPGAKPEISFVEKTLGTMLPSIFLRVKSLFSASNPPISTRASPRLIGSYKGYHLVLYDEFIYAVPLPLWPLDLTSQGDREKPGILVALSESGTRNLIDSRC